MCLSFIHEKIGLTFFFTQKTPYPIYKNIFIALIKKEKNFLKSISASKVIILGGNKLCKDSKRALKTEIRLTVHEDLHIYVNE